MVICLLNTFLFLSVSLSAHTIQGEAVSHDPQTVTEESSAPLNKDSQR